MAYSLVIPQELVSEMYLIREQTDVSIRKQIIQAITAHISNQETPSKWFHELDLLNEK